MRLFKGEGFDVMKSGDARVALIGFPSVGKVSLVFTKIDITTFVRFNNLKLVHIDLEAITK